MVEWLKETFSFVDSELLMMIGIAIMAIILLKVLFKALYRFRILKVLLAVLVFGGLIVMALNYVNTHKDLFSNETRYYVYGRAGFVSNTVRTLELESNKTNLYKGGKGRVVVKIPVGIKILSSETKNKEIGLDEIRTGDILQVYCKENTLEDNQNEVTAVKIVRKYDK